MLSWHFVQSLRIMALIVSNASRLAKWPWCEANYGGGEAICDEGGLRPAREYLKTVLVGWPKQHETPSRCCAALLA